MLAVVTSLVLAVVSLGVAVAYWYHCQKSPSPKTPGAPPKTDPDKTNNQTDTDTIQRYNNSLEYSKHVSISSENFPSKLSCQDLQLVPNNTQNNTPNMTYMTHNMTPNMQHNTLQTVPPKSAGKSAPDMMVSNISSAISTDDLSCHDITNVIRKVQNADVQRNINTLHHQKVVDKDLSLPHNEHYAPGGVMV